MKKLSDKEKHEQILREVKATLLLFLLVAVWHIGTGFLLNGNGAFLLGMPAWFVVSTFGAGIIAIVGVIYLTKKVFIDFEYDDEAEEE